MSKAKERVSWTQDCLLRALIYLEIARLIARRDQFTHRERVLRNAFHLLRQPLQYVHPRAYGVNAWLNTMKLNQRYADSRRTFQDCLLNAWYWASLAESHMRSLAQDATGIPARRRRATSAADRIRSAHLGLLVRVWVSARWRSRFATTMANQLKSDANQICAKADAIGRQAMAAHRATY